MNVENLWANVIAKCDFRRRSPRADNICEQGRREMG